MRRFVRPFLTAFIAAAGAGILIAAPVSAAPATDPNAQSGVDDILRRCAGSGNPEACTREILEEEDECISGECVHVNPRDVPVGADNPNGLSVGAANQTIDSPGASNHNPSPGSVKQNSNRPDRSKKKSS